MTAERRLLEGLSRNPELITPDRLGALVQAITREHELLTGEVRRLNERLDRMERRVDRLRAKPFKRLVLP